MFVLIVLLTSFDLYDFVWLCIYCFYLWFDFCCDGLFVYWILVVELHWLFILIDDVGCVFVNSVVLCLSFCIYGRLFIFVVDWAWCAVYFWFVFDLVLLLVFSRFSCLDLILFSVLFVCLIVLIVCILYCYVSFVLYVSLGRLCLLFLVLLLIVGLDDCFDLNVGIVRCVSCFCWCFICWVACICMWFGYLCGLDAVCCYFVDSVVVLLVSVVLCIVCFWLRRFDWLFCWFLVCFWV